MTRHDLKLQACLRAFDGVNDLLAVANPGLQHVAEAYRRNLTRVNSLIIFPPAAVQIAFNLQIAVKRVESRIPRPQGKAFQDAVREQLDTHKKMVLSLPKEDFEKHTKELEDITIGILQTLEDDEEMFSGFEAWIASQITGTWTAFEAMAGDLWEAALNCKPDELSKLSGQKKIKAKTEDYEAKEVREKGKYIELNTVIRYKFDVSKHMGTILRGKYQFDNLNDIRKAYKDAFGAYINDTIDDTALDAVSAVRNNLVHNGGVIDDRLISRKSILPVGVISSSNERILLDGELSSKLINPVLKLGNELIISVDNWLTTH